MPIELPTGLPWVALDTETSGLHPDDGARVACVALAYSDSWSVALPFDQGVRDKLRVAQISLDLFGHVQDPNLPVEDWQYLLSWLQDQHLVFQNAKFDLVMMNAGTRHWRGANLADRLHWDTMLASGVIDPMEARGLDAQSKFYGFDGKRGLDAVKGWLSANKHPKSRYDLVPWEIIEPYVTTDAVDTARIAEKQWERLDTDEEFTNNEELLDRIERQLDLTKALFGMELRGIGYDDEESMRAADKLEAVAARIEKTMPFAATPTGAKSYFIDKLRLDVERVSEKTGRPTLDEEQVRQWVKDDVPFAREYSDVMRARRAVSMWYRGYPEKIGTDGRLRTVFRQGHVKSGRMSVERVQLQALPKKDKYNAVGSNEKLAIFDGIPGVRDLIFPADGYGLWNLDLSQAELRVAARYSRCKGMLDELLSGDPDIHGKTTQRVMGVSPDDPMYKFKRDIGKRLTFGGIFMVGAETFQATLAKLADIHLPIDECYALVNRWRRQYPEIQVAYRKAERMATEKGYVRLLPNTRYEYQSYFKPTDYPRTAWNRIVQGSLAEAFGIWLGEVEKRWPGRMVLTVHDSIVLECPLDEGDQVAAEIQAYGGELMSELFDIQMSVDIDRW